MCLGFSETTRSLAVVVLVVVVVVVVVAKKPVISVSESLTAISCIRDTRSA
jgi:hypothetical protein